MNSIKTHLKKISTEKQYVEQDAHRKIKDLVSICIPNYNKGPWIEECLESIVHQTYPSLEVILVDDCSTDSTLKRIEHFKKKFEFRRISLTVLESPRRVGTAWAQNMAYYLSRGEFIANMDSDDCCHPERIRRQVQALKDFKWDVVGTNFLLFKKDPSYPDVLDGGYWLKYDTEDIQNSYLFKQVHCVCFGSLLYRANVINTIGGMNKEFIGTEDFDTVLRIAQKGFTIGNLKEPLYYYRTGSNQRSQLFHGATP